MIFPLLNKLMTYEYNNSSYSKRPLTNDIALYVAANDFSLAENKSEDFERLAKPYKLGELAAQQNACPIRSAEGLKERVDFLKRHFDGFRIRNAQISAVIATDGAVDEMDDTTALFLASVGSIAVIAREYRSNSDRTLLSKGILPLVSSEKLKSGSFILIKDIRNNIRGGDTNAFLVFPDRLEPVGIRLGEYDNSALESVLN